MSMNRYMCEGMLRDAQDGKHVLMIGDRADFTDVIRAAKRIEELSSGEVKPARVSLAYGRERIDYPNGGRIWLGQSVRGTPPHVVVLPDGLLRRWHADRTLAALYAIADAEMVTYA